MCGIVGYTGLNAVAPILLQGLEKLEYRGYDSAGVGLIRGNSIEITRASGKSVSYTHLTLPTNREV